MKPLDADTVFRTENIILCGYIYLHNLATLISLALSVLHTGGVS